MRMRSVSMLENALVCKHSPTTRLLGHPAKHDTPMIAPNTFDYAFQPCLQLSTLLIRTTRVFCNYAIHQHGRQEDTQLRHCDLPSRRFPADRSTQLDSSLPYFRCTDHRQLTRRRGPSVSPRGLNNTGVDSLLTVTSEIAKPADGRPSDSAVTTRFKLFRWLVRSTSRACSLSPEAEDWVYRWRCWRSCGAHGFCTVEEGAPRSGSSRRDWRDSRWLGMERDFAAAEG